MNIVVLVDLAKASFGGGVYSMFKFGEALSRIGHYVYIYWINVPEFFNKQFEIDKLRIEKRFAFKQHFTGSYRIDGLIEMFYDYFDIDKFLNKNKNVIDWIIGHQTRTAIKAIKFGRKYDIAAANFVFETPHWLSSGGFEEWNKKWKNPAVKKNWRDFKRSLEMSNVVFPNSYFTKKETEVWLNHAISDPIYPGVDSLPDLGIPLLHSPQNDHIIYVGRLKKHKNVSEIIQALSELNQPQKLIICGEGPERKKLTRLAKKLKVNCEFKGTVTETEKWKLIFKSKFMIFPSSFEGFGMPPMEALACGIPCICSDIPIFHEVYEDKVEYFEEHNIGHLAKKISSLLNNSDYCYRRGQDGKKYVTNKFSWEKSAVRMEQILKEKI